MLPKCSKTVSKTIFAPVGDQSASPARAPHGVIWRTPLPSTLTTNKADFSPGRRPNRLPFGLPPRNSVKTIFLPSGENRGAACQDDFDGKDVTRRNPPVPSEFMM